MKKHLEASLQLDESMGAETGSGHRYYVLLADAAARQRDLEGLRKYAPLAEESATHIDHKLNIAIAKRAWGVAHTLVGEYSQAEECFKIALEIFSSYPAAWQIGRTLFEMGELTRLRKEKKKARDYYYRALGVFEELHAAPYAALARAALENLGGV